MGESKRRWEFKYLQELYHLVSQASRISIPPLFPIMGKNAFTHYAGVHVTAIAKDPMLYQSLNLESLAHQNKLALGMQSGRNSIELALKQIGKEEMIENESLIKSILKEVKFLAKQGTLIDIHNEFINLVNRCVAIENFE